MASSKPPQSPFRPGDPVLTSYGVGVIVGLCRGANESQDSQRPSDAKDAVSVDFYKVRLWRIPGKSIGSSALATLRPATVRFLG